MAEMEVNPQEEMANPKGMKVFAVKRPWLPEDFVSCSACAEMADCLGSATVVGPRRDSVLQVYVFLS